MRINAATCIACLWLASCFFLFFLRPFLEEPARTYAGHGMYSIFFAGIGAALIAFKIRTGSFPPFKAADRRANLAGFDLAGAPIWLATYLVPGVGLGFMLRYLGWVHDRRSLFVVVLCTPLAIVVGYLAYRYFRHSGIEPK
jgi:hypothetical protein